MDKADQARRRLQSPPSSWGTCGTPFDETELDTWSAAIPHAEVHRINTAGHFVQEDEPELALDLVERFLAHD